MRILGTLLMIAWCGVTHAQQVSIGTEVFAGSFSMTSLKQYQALSENYFIPFENVQNFPVRPGVRILATIDVFEQWRTGILLGLVATGSRMAYSDYTGQAYRDVTVSGFHFGSYNRYALYHHDQWSIHARLNVGGVLNNVMFENYFHLEDPEYETSETSDWRSINFFSEIGVEAGYIWDRLFFKIFSSYEMNIPGVMEIRAGQPPEGTFDVDWSGFRGGVGIDFKLAKTK